MLRVEVVKFLTMFEAKESLDYCNRNIVRVYIHDLTCLNFFDEKKSDALIMIFTALTQNIPDSYWAT